MSRIGRKPIAIPGGVTVRVEDRTVRVKGPKGELSLTLTDGIDVTLQDSGELRVTRAREDRNVRAMHGTTRALLANMVTGVSQGFTKQLQVWGVGYSAEVKGKTLRLNIGYSDLVEITIPEGLAVATERVSVEGENVWQISVSGIDRHAVGQLAACIRQVRPPEPYKGKGIRYAGERIVRKAGKSFQSGG